jgi:hypothetical protein
MAKFLLQQMDKFIVVIKMVIQKVLLQRQNMQMKQQMQV